MQSPNGDKAHLTVLFFYKVCCFEVFLKASALGFRGFSASLKEVISYVPHPWTSEWKSEPAAC